jgi:formylglycine-generating enzyme required for sulfatase activity
MNTVFPGDKLWGRYRVERLIGNGSSGAWLTSVPDLPRNENEIARYLLVPLREPAVHPLAELLALLRHALRFEDAAPRTSRKRAPRRVRLQRYGRKSLPVLGEVEWIGEQSGDGVAILSAPPAIPLNAWIETNGPLTAAQLLPVMLRFSRGLAQLTESVEAAAPRPAILERFFRSLARLLNPGAVALAADSAELILRRQAGEPAAECAPPPHADFLAPELFRAEPATSAALVFGAARLGAVLAGLKVEADKNAETGWARLAEWAAGKRDPAREFLADSASDTMPVELRELLARCLSKNRSRRLLTPDKFALRLKDLAETDWARVGAVCQSCGFVILSEQTVECPCCGNSRSTPEQSAASAGAGTAPADPRARRRSTTTILKSRPQSGATAVAAPKIEGMTVIEAGMFLSGEDKTPRSLRAFAIDTLPVTEAEYKKYLAAIGKSAREGGPGSREAAFDSHPAAGVTWYEANDYAEHHGKRLPTVFEWEKAARGSDGRKFPFGNTFKSRAEQKKKNVGTFPAGTFPEGASPFGIQDMAGNVLCWTSSARRAGDRLFRAVKGSCYLDGSPELSRCASVQYLPPETSEAHLGFRCVKDVD